MYWLGVGWYVGWLMLTWMAHKRVYAACEYLSSYLSRRRFDRWVDRNCS